LRSLRTLWGLAGSKYTAKPLEDYLKRITQETRLSDLVKPAIFTSYDLRAREVINFSTREACSLADEQKKDETTYGFKSYALKPDSNYMIKEKNFLLWQALRASTAAAVYYKPYEIEIGRKQRALIDAGLFIMSPTLLAWIEAKKIYPDRRFIIVSIGSGTLKDARVIKAKGNTAGSIPQVIQPTIETALEGQQALTDEMMKALPDVTYFRLSFDVKSKEFDDFSDANIEALKNAARAQAGSPQFDKMIAALTQGRKERKEDTTFKPFICNIKQEQLDIQKKLIK
jgi:patatin-like phospholipase/acyl hydrolase